MKFFLILLSFIVSSNNYLSAVATYVNISGCPSLFLFQIDPKINQTLPPCFCDNATSADDPPVAVNCLVQSTFQDLTTALTNVQKSGKKLSTVNVEYMKFDDQIGIPDNYFQKFGFAPAEISIAACQNDRLPLNQTFGGLEKSLKKLTISGCNVLVVPASIAKLASLESLTLQETFIYTIYKNDFRGLKNLKYLNLVGNQIYHLESGAFDDLSNVETALLGPRNALNSSAFREINKLVSAKTLNLQYNSFEILPNNSLNALRRLEILDLSTNALTNITADSLASLTNLKKLILSQNLITNIDDGSFRNLNNLKELNIAANYVEDIWPETFQGLKSLEILNLDWNNLYVIDRGTFTTTPKLQTLILRKQQNLQYLSADAFEGLRDLRHLNLAKSNVTTIETDLLKPIGIELQSLNLSESSLYYLTTESFHYGARIQNLSLAGTSLDGLPDGVFAYLTHLRYLDLSNVKWICDDQLAWLVNWLKDQMAATNLTLVDSNLTTCWAPLELRNRPLLSLDPSTLRPYVALTEIDQPPTTTTTPWWKTTKQYSFNDTDSNSSLLLRTTPGASSTSTKKIAIFGEPIQNPSDNNDSTKTKIIIAIVASVGSVATIAVVLIVVMLMRKRRRKQDEQNRNAVDGQNGRTKSIEDTEMTTTQINETNGAARNGLGASAPPIDAESENRSEIDDGRRRPKNPSAPPPSLNSTRRHASAKSDEV